MISEQIKQALAPCGLNCAKCFAHIDGDIRRYSLKLKEALGHFDPYAKRFETLMAQPIFGKYADFRKKTASDDDGTQAPARYCFRNLAVWDFPVLRSSSSGEPWATIFPPPPPPSGPRSMM